jgi:hypothetical protein
MLIVLGAWAGAAIVPFDFTKHWWGQVMQDGQTGTAEADLSGTGTFTGTLGIQFEGVFLTCSVTNGKQKKKVTLTATCSDGGTAKLKAKLDETLGTLTGKYKSHRPGHKGHHGTFILHEYGSCVPTGQDCTDPSTGGGEGSVCCNGDCTLGGTPTAETHSCN